MIFARTGDLCSVSGFYRCFGNFDLQIKLTAGEIFPKTMDMLNAFWILVNRSES